MSGTATTSVRDGLLQSLKWRCIGPHRGGRVVAVAGDVSDRETFYFGACAGGVWKTTDGGADLAQRLGRLLQDRGGRRDRRLGVRPERDLRRHGRDGDPRQRLARRRRLQVDRRRQDLAQHGAARHAATSARSQIHPTQPGPRLRRGARPRLGAERGARRLPHERRRRDAGRRCSTRATAPARTTLRWTRTTRASSTPPSGRRSATRTRCVSGGEECGIWRSTDGGDTWEEITRKPGLPKGLLGKIGVAASRGASRAGLGAGRGRGRRASSAPTTAARPGSG